MEIINLQLKRATTREVLDGIEEDVKKLESTLQRNQKLQKKIVLSLLTISICSYLVAMALEDVMDNETYKIAKELLEKFDPEGKIIMRDTAIKSVPATPKTPSQGELRHRTNGVKPGEINGDQLFKSPQMQDLRGTPRPGGPNFAPRFATPNMNQRTPYPVGIQRNGNQSPAGTPRPRATLQMYPVLPLERSVFDKVAEYFIGDGPSYRYALICKNCHGHNGMALKDEFEFVAFNCCYCGAPNPARKARPNAPALEDSKLSDQGTEQDKKTEKEGKSDESDLESSKEVESKPGPDETDDDIKERCSSDDGAADGIVKENKDISEEDE
eukprot:gene14099-5087_t